MTLPDPVQLAVPAFVILVIGEILLLRLRQRDGYGIADTAASLAMGFGNTLVTTASAGLILAVLGFAYRFRVFEIGFVWWAFPVIFLAEDFCYYWFHRLSHERRIWWASHVVHHSSQYYNLSTALRQTWTGTLSLTWLPWVPLAILGFPPALIVFQQGVNLVYQFWIHTEAIDRMPRWFEAVFNTPSHHRVHHATNPRYLDANYAGTLIIWDKLFGSFVAECPDDPPRYGIVRDIASFNPLLIALHEWIGIVRDLRAAGTWRRALGYLFGPPGWSHDGSRRTSRMIKQAWQSAQDSRFPF